MSDWKGWKITDEQATQIRSGNREAINKFYFDNLNRLRSMACNYLYKHKLNKLFKLDDLINSLYLDLSVFKQANGKPVTCGYDLSYFVYSSFAFAKYGGLLYLFENNQKILNGNADCYKPYLYSLDRPLSRSNATRHHDDENDSNLFNLLLCEKSQEDFDNIEKEDLTEDLKELVRDLLSKKEFECFCHFIEGYSWLEISHRMGYKSSNNLHAVYTTLRKNYLVILKRLDKLGVNVYSYLGKTPYVARTDKIYKLSEERRAAGRRSRQKYLAKLKAQKAEQDTQQ